MSMSKVEEEQKIDKSSFYSARIAAAAAVLLLEEPASDPQSHLALEVQPAVIGSTSVRLQ
jgi:hypothetical protein